MYRQLPYTQTLNLRRRDSSRRYGITISGDAGTAGKDGVVMEWTYNATDQTLTIGDVKKPWYVRETTIDKDLTALVESVVSAQGGTK